MMCLLRNAKNCKPTILILILIDFIKVYGETSADVKPHVVIIMADDMGFDDVSFRGSNKFLTPNIDALAYNGIILNNLYTAAMCTPSRSALLTGKYPINIGMQHFVIPNYEPWGLPIEETTMADIFQQNGYHTALIGKWHQGMSRKAYTPTLRGFKQHLGYLGAYIDYYEHTLDPEKYNLSIGHDFRDNMQITHKYTGQYATDVLTHAAVDLIMEHNVTEAPLFLMLNHLAPHAGNKNDPLQAPSQEIEKFAYIKDKNKRIYAAMVSKVDSSVGEVIDALAQRQILNNTIILFLSDNGGPTVGMHNNTASNYPLRGQKDTPWEGAIRSSAALWSTQFEHLGRVWKQDIYIGDFLPTLAAAAGITLDTRLNLDGLNLWHAIKYNYEKIQREIVHNIDMIVPYTAYSSGKYKYVNGTTSNGSYDSWLGTRPTEENDSSASDYERVVRQTKVWRHLEPFGRQAGQSSPNISALRAETAIVCQFQDDESGEPCLPLVAPCFFDLDVDPCEQNNLYEDYKNQTIFLAMMKRIEYHKSRAREPNNKPWDEKCNPKLYNGEWTWWEDGGDGSNRSVRSFSALTFIFNITASVCVLWCKRFFILLY